MHLAKSNRRSFLGGAALGMSGLVFGNLLPRRALAQAAVQRKFVFAYFEGGWDLLLGLDPRDPATTRAAEQQIEPGYGQLAATYQARGVQRRGSLSFGPAVPPEMLAHAADVSIVNAVTMDTASHEAGRRYFITGRFPRGITAVGSSTPSEIIAQVGDRLPIPHLSAGVESYSTGLPAHAAALSINSLNDLLVALTPFTSLDPAVLSAVEAYQDEGAGCEGTRLDRDGLTTSALRSQKRAREYIRAQLAQLFDLTRTDVEMTRLRELYGIGQGSTVASTEVLSFVAGQALKQRVTQCVSVRVAGELDTHSNWAQDQAPRQESGWRNLAALISDLKATESAEVPGQSLFEETTILAFSEFGRTPLFNNLRGRDHFIGSSCLVAGAGVKRGLVIGRSSSVGMMPIDTDLMTGHAVENATAAQRETGNIAILTPKHILATVLASAGLDAAYLRTAPIRALLA
ncbi:MAG: DUF1501 domain-containing protein [Deltaproteobacteria bacterium]|nr:DUF1501 domain-containing protein [Deltaproteobacteria bacterium]